ncbi:MAG: TlpA family protein disulfide reductase [Propionibacteriaceae bacterium]
MRSARRRFGAGVAVAMIAIMATGCAETPQVRAGDPTVSNAPPVDPGVAAASTPALARQKKAAGLPDCPASDAAVPPVTQGLPDLTLACLGGGRSTRLAGLRGTPMVLNLWAQWCGPCRTEAPFLAEIAGRAGDRVLVLGVDYKETEPALAIDFARASGWTYPQLFDQDGRVTEALRLPTGPPQTIFVGADGVITYVHAGEFRSTGDLREAIRAHLGIAL